MKNKIILLITFIIISIFYTGVNASIKFTVSPTKYEIEALKGTTINRQATLYNYSKETYTITTGKANFTTDGQTGIPKIINGPNIDFPDQELASWIEIETLSFIIAPGEKKTINFKINIPQDATPGGHYGVVFFKNNSNGTNISSNGIGINVDYGILILVNVDGNTVVKGAPENITVSGGGGSSYLSRKLRSKKVLSLKKDDCPIYDFTNSNFDGKCLLGTTNNNTGTVINKQEEQKSFKTSFNIPFKNEGNTHIKPTGKIILIDEDGNELKGIGQKLIKNKKGAIVGEKIVDYIPINDEGGNILPNSKRDFNLYWKGFSYKTYDNEGNEIIKYWNPSEYYTKKNIENRGFIMFWERYSERINHKKITALIDLSYKDDKGENVDFNSAKEFYIDYKESYIGYNPYVILGLIIFGIIFLIIYLRKYFNKIKCKKCDSKIDKNAKACPYCGKKVKNKNK